MIYLKRPWCWERLKAGGEGDDRGWDGWMASPTQWTWVWVGSGSWWWTGRLGVLWSIRLQRGGHHWETELNWYKPSPLTEWPFDTKFHLPVTEAKCLDTSLSFTHYHSSVRESCWLHFQNTSRIWPLISTANIQVWITIIFCLVWYNSLLKGLSTPSPTWVFLKTPIRLIHLKYKILEVTLLLKLLQWLFPSVYKPNPNCDLQGPISVLAIQHGGHHPPVAIKM